MVQDLQRDDVAQLHYKTGGLGRKMILRPVKFAGKIDAGRSREKELTPCGAACREELAEFAEILGGQPVLVNHRQVRLDGVRRPARSAQMFDAAFGRLFYQWIGVMLMRNRCVLPFEEVLVNSEALIKESQCGLKPPRDSILFARIETVRVDAEHPEKHHKSPALGEKNILADGRVDIDQGVQRAGVVVVFQNPFERGHRAIPPMSNFAGLYCARNL